MLLNSAELAEMRRTFRLDIHNNLVDARLQLGPESAATTMPGYKAKQVQQHTTVSNFPCSYYQFLSGKTTRVFRSRLEEQVFASGLWNDTEWMLQFVPGLTEVLLHTGASTNAVPSDTILEDSLIDFQVLGIVAGALVVNTIDGSQAIVVTVNANSLVTEILSGGTLNLYTAGDVYSVYNPTACKVGDQFFINGRWRNVLGVIPDSEGVQSTALCSD